MWLVAAPGLQGSVQGSRASRASVRSGGGGWSGGEKSNSSLAPPKLPTTHTTYRPTFLEKRDRARQQPILLSQTHHRLSIPTYLLRTLPSGITAAHRRTPRLRSPHHAPTHSTHARCLYLVLQSAAQVLVVMALLDKVPGDLKLYIGGYVFPIIRTLPRAIWQHGWLIANCIAFSPCAGATPSSRLISLMSCLSCVCRSIGSCSTATNTW